MSEKHQLKEKLKNCYKSGFFLDKNTFLKADDADVVMVPHKDDDGRVVDRQMIVLKNVVEMMVDRRGKIVAVENKSKLGVWVASFENALDKFNKELSPN
jgi:tricorn protease-like protein